MHPVCASAQVFCRISMRLEAEHFSAAAAAVDELASAASMLTSMHTPYQTLTRHARLLMFMRYTLGSCSMFMPNALCLQG